MTIKKIPPVISEHGTPVFDPMVTLKMPKKKEDTRIKPKMVFEGFTEDRTAKSKTQTHKKMAKKNPPKKKKDKTHKVTMHEPI
jgi:hypothetical protein